MKEDILEQLVDEFLQHRGYFTRHNDKFRPGDGHKDFVVNDDCVSSDIDVMGFNPMLRGSRRVIVVTCKSWQSGFDPRKWLEAFEGKKTLNGRPAWKAFRELLVDKWSTAFREMVAEATGSIKFTYVLAVTKLSGDASLWTENSRFRDALGGNPLEIWPLSQLLTELAPRVDTTLASTEIGRLLQVVRASGYRFGCE